MRARIVDDRVLVLGIDSLYRDAMKVYEVTTLLPCARTVAARLGLQPLTDLPVEGYYTESRSLREYFGLMRRLQSQPAGSDPAVEGLAELRRLREAAGSRIFGCPQELRDGKRMLLPRGRDPFWLALDTLPVQAWDVEPLCEAAHRAALDRDDVSLVGLAARARDAVLLAALRESAVLYAERLDLIGDDGDEECPEYRWRVSPGMQRAANRFIDLFNGLVAEANARLTHRELLESGFHCVDCRPLPAAEPGNAASFWRAHEDNDIQGRCVCIATVEGSNYHWAIRSAAGDAPRLEVQAFWSAELWTTERYREARRAEAASRTPRPRPSKPAQPAPRSPAEYDTLIELAGAFLEVEDTTGAREILDEILRHGDESQRARARELLRR